MNHTEFTKQTATATSDFHYVLTGGVAPADHLTFWDSFQVPTYAEIGGDMNPWTNVSILVRPDGSADWQIINGSVKRLPGDELEFIDGFFVRSSTGSPLALTGDADVTVTQVMASADFNYLAVGTEAPAGTYPTIPSGGLGSNKTFAVNGGVLAAGPGARASGKYSVVMGASLYGALGEMMYGLGAMAFGSGAIGDLWQSMILRKGYTTDDTPTAIGLFDQDGAIADAEWMYVDAGVMQLTGFLSAYDHATEDHKLWRVEAFAKTSQDYASTTVIGSPTFTLIDASAGAGSWSATVTADSSENAVKLVATGEDGVNLSWDFTGLRRMHAVYP